jgi:hypothetical protein
MGPLDTHGVEERHAVGVLHLARVLLRDGTGDGSERGLVLGAAGRSGGGVRVRVAIVSLRVVMASLPLVLVRSFAVARLVRPYFEKRANAFFGRNALDFPRNAVRSRSA